MCVCVWGGGVGASVQVLRQRPSHLPTVAGVSREVLYWEVKVISYFQKVAKKIIKGKGKFRPRTGLEGPENVQR